MTTEADLSKALEDMGRAFEEFKTEHTKLIRKGVQDVLAESKLDKLGQAIDDLTGKKEDLERRIKLEGEERQALERKLNLLSLGDKAPSDEIEQKALVEFNRGIKSLARQRGREVPQDFDVAGFRAYKSATEKFLRYGRDQMSVDEVKTLQVGTDADGGIFVNPETSGRVVTRLRELSPMRQICAVQTISTDKLTGIEDLGEAGAGWVGETAARTANDETPDMGAWEISVKEMYSQPKTTQQLLDDASVDVESWLAAKVSDKMARVEGSAFCIGDGVLKPRGFTTYTTVATADASRAWGQFEHIKSDANGAFAAANTYPSDKLIELEAAFRPGYLPGAVWVMPRAVLTAIRKFKDGQGLYLWQPGLSAGAPNTILNYPVAIMQDMPALATDSLSLALGNFKIAYQIVERQGLRVLRDPYTDKPYVKFYTTARVGGAAVNFEAAKFIKFSA